MKNYKEKNSISKIIIDDFVEINVANFKPND